MRPAEHLKALYDKLPVPLQSTLVSLEGWRVQRERTAGSFSERLSGYLRRESASEDEVLAFRRDRLRTLLDHAAREVPYWKALFHSVGLDPHRVEGPEDLAVLPVLTKSDIIRLGSKLRWTSAPRSQLRTVHTSGTTGAGLIFVTTLETIRDQWAVWWRYRMRHGLGFRTWSATFGGQTVVPGTTTGPPYWRANWPGRQVLYSQYHLGPATIHDYLGDLASRRLEWFHGYPSVLSLLATLCIESGVPARPTPHTVTVGAENLLATQRRVIREAFRAEPLQHYGLAEGVANASECLARNLHIDEDFSAVELQPASDGTFRILGTCFENKAMPLIRYDTGDLARLLPGGCGCGLPGRVLEAIDGRQEDLVVLSDGSRIGRLDHLFKDMVRIAEAQIRQDHPGSCVIALVPRQGFGDGDERLLLEECRRRFGNRLAVRIEVVNLIPRTASGKLRLVLSGSEKR